MGGALFCGPDLWSPLAGPFARLDERACPAGGYFSMMKSSKRFLGRVCGRLAAGRRFCRVQSRYAYPAGAYFCMRKSRQNALGAVPQDPLAAKLRLDTNDAKASSVQRRRYALKVPAAHFYVEIVDRVPLPRIGGGERGCGAERRQWRMQRGGAPAAVEKIEQASSAKIFSGTARRWGQIRRGCLWSASVRSTDLDFSPQKNPNS